MAIALDALLAPLAPGGDPASTSDVDGVSLDAYALTSARLAARAAPRAAVLASAGLDEARWLSVEATWLARIAGAALASDAALVEAFQAASARAADEVAAGRVPSIEAWADVVAALERSGDPARALDAAGIRLADVGPAARAWAARTARDPALAARLRALVDERVASPERG